MLQPRPSQSSDSELDTLSDPEILLEEFNRFEELIFQSSQIPLSRWIVVDEKKLLDRLESIRENWPDAFIAARAILEQKRDIIARAEAYAENLIEESKQQAANILDETGIIQQARIEADRLREQAKQECLVLQQQTLAQIEEVRAKALQEIEQMRRVTIAECEEVENGADDYAEEVLSNLDRQLTQMLKVIRNGRKHLNHEMPPPRSKYSKKQNSEGKRQKDYP